jgi:hypothetical protein
VNTKILSLGVVIGALFTGCASSHSIDQVAPLGEDLSGSWILNADKSDNPGDQVGTAGMAGGGSMRPPPDGMGRRPGRRGGMGGIDPEKMHRTMEMAREAVQRFTLEQTDTTVTISYNDMPPHVFHTDGRKIEQETEAGDKIEVKAYWQGRYLMISRKIDGGGTITDQYFKSSVTDQLEVITRIELGRMPQPMQFLRVYDAASRSKE